MKQNSRLCHKILINSPKDLQIYLKRQQNHIENTPKIILAKQQNNLQQIWTDDLKNDSLPRLRQLNSSQKAYIYARCIILTCKRLSSRYSYFILNQNMVFLDDQKKLYVWINPDILENTVKIYLPHSPEGEAMMIRSIITFLKLWLKCDYQYLSEAKHLDQLLMKFDILQCKNNEGFKPISNQKKYIGSHKKVSIFLPEQPNSIRYSTNAPKTPELNLLIENRSSREICQTPNKEQILFKSLSSKQKYIAKQVSELNTSEKQGQAKNKTTLSRNTDHASDKIVDFNECDYQIKSFNSINNITKMSINESQGIKSGSNYFPNRTTSNKSHPIVSLINSQNGSSNEYKQNKLLIEDDEAEVCPKKARQSLDGIGEQLNQLFFSNIQSDGHKQQEMKKIEEQFSTLLN